MHEIKLTYFDVNGGRAEPIRLVLYWMNQPFDDNRISFEEFEEARAATPFGQVPVVDMDGACITQTNALLRYFGIQAGLYPENTMAALLCDEAMDVVEDSLSKLVFTFGLTGNELEKARARYIDKSLSPTLCWMNQRLEESLNGYFAGGRLSIADFKVWCFINSFLTGIVDHVSPELIGELAPNVLQHSRSLSQLEKIQQYYSQRD